MACANLHKSKEIQEKHYTAPMLGKKLVDVRWGPINLISKVVN